MHGSSLRGTPSRIQEGDNGRVRQDGSSQGREKKLDSGNNLNVELIGFPDQLYVDCESTSELRMSPRLEVE